jgi:hypothetical protein
MTLLLWCAKQPSGVVSRLAADVDLSPGRMSRIVNGHVRPTVDVALRIAELTGGAVSLEELLGLEGEIPACVRLRAADPLVELPATPKASPSRAADKRQPDLEEYLDRVECESSGTNPDDPVARAEARRRRLARVGRAA